MNTHAITALLAPPATATDRSTEFVAVEGGKESTSAGGLLVAAYALMWMLLLAFLWMTWRRQRALEERMAKLAATVDRAAQRLPPGA